MRKFLGSMSLRSKMVVAIAALILVLGLGGTIHARLTLSGISNDELDQRALALARDLESRSSDLLMTNDIFGLHRRIGELVAANSDVRYVVVLDQAGNARASTFAGNLPEGLRQANSVAAGSPYSLATLKTDEGTVRDVAYPIDGGRAGVIRVGLTKEPVQSQVDQLTFNLFGLTGAALLAGLVVSYFLATVLTRPLSRLAEAARAVGRGESPVQDELYGHPEIGQVAVAFDAMTHQLREKEAERSQLLARVLTAQEEERRRISRELHDEAGQALTSLLMGLTRIEQAGGGPEVKAQAAELRAVTTDALDLMRDMARDLRPSTLDDLGLVAALGRYVSDYGPRHHLETDFQAASMDGARLRPEVEIVLYRIAQEALTNVSRHADAHSVNVLLERRNGHAILVVEDDGHGFDVERVGAGLPGAKLGLLGMEERAGLVGGTLTVESRPGAGTAVFVEVPLGTTGDKRDANPDS